MIVLPTELWESILGWGGPLRLAPFVDADVECVAAHRNARPLGLREKRLWPPPRRGGAGGPGAEGGGGAGGVSVIVEQKLK